MSKPIAVVTCRRCGRRYLYAPEFRTNRCPHCFTQPDAPAQARLFTCEDDDGGDPGHPANSGDAFDPRPRR